MSTAPSDSSAGDARYRAFIQATADIVYRMTADWKVMIGLEGKNFVAHEKIPNPNWLTENLPPEEHDRVLAAIADAVRKKGIFQTEHRVYREDGTVGWTFSRAIPILDERGEILEWFGVARDITEQVLDREKLRERDLRLRFMAESMPQKIFTTTADGQVDYHNAQWMEFTGLTAEQMRDWGWVQFIHPDDVQQTLKAWGTAITTGVDFEIEQRFRRKDGVYRWHLSRARAMRSDDGKVTMWLGSSTDISEIVAARETLEQRQAELEEKVEQRTQSLRKAIEQMEEFSYTVSHDLRAPLRSIQGFAQVLRSDYGDRLDDVAQDYLNRIEAASVRMDRLTRDILTYSKLGVLPVQLAPVHLEPLIKECIHNLPTFAQGRARAEVKGQLGTVLAHEALLMQAVTNLLNNGAKFVRSGTTPHVQIHSELRDGQRVRLYIVDNGIGIPREHHSRIWGMFERLPTVERYDGTGVGLALVRKAVERMGGSVGLESDGVNGSCFWIELHSVQ